ncbi:hypothetical protein PPYR_09396 [Photinus pyralis]|uniref:Winged helix Storkhead-box1 domain-containing protein n=3 Tax=Photinus pyralis TaxID=7054 RepID=A0A1Y1LQJ9_PHOPY|nr:dentin sialophosphoprotein-like isoform X2 [Photinus pyralis]XP_031342693.1 dentin sialophosphoprotein-like isoform X2 [Photinus pyralis]XP_031342695.1 dentin sialophosphoprotein-like isoform X2 [Photinus pyralis]XP_031342696.1 dentin sialophosphoprotein-like isoform X2 [Photinus pyralis]XP_031342697.1 dentin sialophosphoprotein-like [Photinus pyralis]KAB0798402.1 hypothetical protein PPYR_09395 [Photinus pyralis]KAB0798403.1 hypothetical protein PPYR_09396 [Photinus pyralis]
MSINRPECRVMLRRCLAIIVRKEGCQGDPGDFWMYESGYMLFQGFIAANAVCWWSNALQGATRGLVYRGYISPGALLVSAEPCSLEVLRGAWARRVLQPPSGYKIVGIEDIEECLVTSVAQTQWTPLPEAVCAVVLRLSSQGRPAGIESIREALILAFPHVSPPSERTIYDTLAQLTTERKLYHTSKGYFIVTPERRRSRSHSRGRRKHEDGSVSKGLLMSNEEALVLVHGEMATIRDGDITHQCIQTNLADVICGGNASDKILYARTNKRRSASFPAHRSPDRRGSFRLWGTARRLRRSASTRTIAKHCTDSSSSTDYPNSSDSTQNSKKPSLFTRLFRRSRRSPCHFNTFSAQFPPMEWFNSKAIHLHSVSTQTTATDKDSAISLPYYFENSEVGSARSATLPRQHRRQLSNDSTYVTSYVESRDQSPSLKRNSPSHASSTLPRNSSNLRSPFHSTRSYASSRRTSRSSLSPKIGVSSGEVQADVAQRLNASNSPIRDAVKPNTTKTPSLESLKTSHNTIKKSTKPELREHSNESTSAINKSSLHELTTAFKNSVALDNSGPSSIESHKSSKTASSATSGPSSLESHRTVITRPPNNSSSPSGNSKRSPAKVKEGDRSKAKEGRKASNLPHSNSFTLQVTTNQGGSLTNNANNAMTATINGGNSANTKIYVQNSPVRSVITFENGQSADSNPNVVIINGTEPVKETVNCPTSVAPEDQKYSKNINSSGLNNTTVDRSCKEPMNNNRKLSLQIPMKEGLNYKNILKNQVGLVSPDLVAIQSFGGFTRNSFCSNPPSPTKSYDSICDSAGSILSKYVSDSKTSLEKRVELPNNLVEKNILGSEPNISYKQDYRDKTLTRDSKLQDSQFPSLSDLSFNFTSLAAQKILQGVSINSIDTLVELNTAAVEKQNNCDVVHTDFGLV